MRKKVSGCVVLKENEENTELFRRVKSSYPYSPLEIIPESPNEVNDLIGSQIARREHLIVSEFRE